MNKQEEQKRIFESWSKTGLLSGVGDRDVHTFATLLETQRLLEKSEHKKYMIPLVCRVYYKLAAFNLVSVQAMMSPSDFVFFEDKYGNVQSVVLAARVRMLSSTWEKMSHSDDLQESVVKIREISESIANEIDREVFKDLLKVSKLQLDHGWSNRDKFLDWLMITGAKVKGGANWLVTDPDIGLELEQLEEFKPIESSGAEIERKGKLFGKWDVYVDEQFPTHTVLIGRRGTRPYDSGYIYCPYMPFSVVESTGIMTRYSKKLIDPTFYAKITVNGYSSSEQDVLVATEKDNI